MAETRGSGPISPKLRRIAELARERPQTALTTLAHHLDLLLEAYRRTRKDGAVGVDGQTAEAYAEHLEANLRALLERAKSGAYRAPPVRRVHLPKVGSTKTRPIGISTFEDKVLQRAVAMLLEVAAGRCAGDSGYTLQAERPGIKIAGPLGCAGRSTSRSPRSATLDLLSREGLRCWCVRCSLWRRPC